MGTFYTNLMLTVIAVGVGVIAYTEFKEADPDRVQKVYDKSYKPKFIPPEIQRVAICDKWGKDCAYVQHGYLSVED